MAIDAQISANRTGWSLKKSISNARRAESAPARRRFYHKERTQRHRVGRIQRVALLAVLIVLALTPWPHAAPQPAPPRPAAVPSRSIGLPWAGRLVHGVQLPSEGAHFFTWDPVLRRSPDRAWRRWGTDRLVWLSLRVVDEYAAAHPDAPRVGIGDLSRPRGGDFGIRYGWPGHVSHQNGRDVDVYYPRLDRRERAPTSPAQIDHALAQDLVDRFVRAGAVRIFVGPNTGLTGPRSIVAVLPHHDNHLHVRIR
jgi:murein endopeptidase